jgi:hypothetical protein
MTSERRQSKRATFYTEACLEDLAAGRGDVRLADLSVEGAFVDTREVLTAGATALLRFTLCGREVSVVAEVCYSIHGIGMGVVFLDLSDADRVLVDQFVSGEHPRVVW